MAQSKEYVKERKEIIEEILTEAKIKGKIDTSSSPIKIYELYFSYCSLKILDPGYPQSTPVIMISEHFGDPEFTTRGISGTIFDGIRTLYMGTYEGLFEVALQGIYHPGKDGSSLTPAERLLRYYDSKDGRQLTNQDKERFDAFLKYVQKNI